MTRVRALAPVLVAGALTVVAVLTVRHAGCEEPGRYELRGGSYELVGGCLEPGDLVVQEPAANSPTELTRPARG
ncbi:MAG: hypothetical protein AB7J32_26510 [Pseudonocardia sp.]|mgnify:CR=1 FL=1